MYVHIWKTYSELFESFPYKTSKAPLGLQRSFVLANGEQQMLLWDWLDVLYVQTVKAIYKSLMLF